MKKFKFEVQSLINVEIEADNVDEARTELVMDKDMYASELVENCCISEGEEIKEVKNGKAELSN